MNWLIRRGLARTLFAADRVIADARGRCARARVARGSACRVIVCERERSVTPNRGRFLINNRITTRNTRRKKIPNLRRVPALSALYRRSRRSRRPARVFIPFTVRHGVRRHARRASFCPKSLFESRKSLVRRGARTEIGMRIARMANAPHRDLHLSPDRPRRAFRSVRFGLHVP